MLDKVVEIESKMNGSAQRIEVIEGQIVEVGQKYEQF